MLERQGRPGAFDLIAPVREIEWYCEDSQEFSSNDEPYDRVRVGREGGDSDKMTLVFLRLPPTPLPASRATMGCRARPATPRTPATSRTR